MRQPPFVRVKSREKEKAGTVLNFPKECAIMLQDVETIGPSPAGSGRPVETEGDTHDSRPNPERCYLEAERGPRRLRRVPDFLPIRVQDLLYRGQPEVREQEVSS